MRGLGTRLAKIEARLPMGCPTCRTWWDTVLADEDGRVDRPERCPDCGRLVPIRVRVCIVGIPLDAL